MAVVKGKSAERVASFGGSALVSYPRPNTLPLSVPNPDTGLQLVPSPGQRLPCQCDQMATRLKPRGTLSPSCGAYARTGNNFPENSNPLRDELTCRDMIGGWRLQSPNVTGVQALTLTPLRC